MEIKLPCILDGYKRKKDRSYSLNFITDLELGKEDRDQIDEAWQQEGWLIFAPNGTEVEIPKEKADVDGGKSPTRRLYDRMFVYHKEKGIKTKFGLWREAQLEKIGQKYLNEIPNNY